ncbi:MAG: type VI secretion system tube protein Hcp, partial [Desulfobacteraceae bacterium]|nr:type VI secretion system tube protein Hcp [Desulfobacteraceae bacterium]
MPTPCYLSIEGERQGLISAGAFTEDSVGNIYQDEHADQILVQSVGHAMTVPTDP